jgi:hypothetical protein
MLQKIRFVFFFFDKKDPKLSLSELLSMMTRIQFNKSDKDPSTGKDTWLFTGEYWQKNWQKSPDIF